MILPHTYAGALLLAILSMVCLASWANAQKLTGKWRFELFYWDFAFGALLAAVVIGFTFGNLGEDGFQITDDLMRSGKQNMAYSLGSGVIFNLANMLLVGAISVAGMFVAFPIAIGASFIVGVAASYLLSSKDNGTLLFLGIAFVAGALLAASLAHRRMALMRAKEVVKSGRTKSTRPKSGAWKAIVLSLTSGLLMGGSYPLMERGLRVGEGLGAYSVGLLFMVGVFISALALGIFFMNLPVQGDPVSFRDYFNGTKWQHLLGILGGLVWSTGILAALIVPTASKPVPDNVINAVPEPLFSPAVAYCLEQLSGPLAAMWGLLVWKEARGGDTSVRSLAGITILLFLIGVGLVLMAWR